MHCQEITGNGQKCPKISPGTSGLVGLGILHSLRHALVLLLLDFQNSDYGSKGSQEPDKQLTSPEVIARSNSSD